MVEWEANVAPGDEQAALGRGAGDHPAQDWGWPPMGVDAFSQGETAASGGLASVTVMQSVWRFDRAGERTILVEGSVAAILVIISQVISENLAEVLPTEDDDVVQTFAANRANDSFDHGILPRRPRGNEFLFQAQGFDSTREIRAIDGIPISEQIMRRDRVGESFNDLLRRSWASTRKTYRTWNVAVGTAKKSTATKAWAWF
jgi:hypothetical protein